MAPKSWRDDAACKGKTRLFYEACWEPTAEDKRGIERSMPVKSAIAACRALCFNECPVRKDCFGTAMITEAEHGYRMRYGIWAGLTPAQRRHVEVTTGWKCKKCLRIYDPKGLMAGKISCGCGVRTVAPLPDLNDRILRQLRKPKEVPNAPHHGDAASASDPR